MQRDLINAWRNAGGIQADFYKVAHHGAYQGGDSSTTIANKDHFLEAVSPKYAFSSSAAPPNSYRQSPSLWPLRASPPTAVNCKRAFLDKSANLLQARGIYERILNNNYGIYSTSPQSDQPIYDHTYCNKWHNIQVSNQSPISLHLVF